jgi:hypothetical protein
MLRQTWGSLGFALAGCTDERRLKANGLSVFIGVYPWLKLVLLWTQSSSVKESFAASGR